MNGTTASTCPERVGIPGFLRGRRYIAVRGAPEFFTLYEATRTDVLAGPHYLERPQQSTPLNGMSSENISTIWCAASATCGSRSAAGKAAG